MNLVGAAGPRRERLARLVPVRHARRSSRALAVARGDAERAARWSAHREALRSRARERRLGRGLVPARLLRRRHARSARPPTANAASTRSRSPGRCSRARPIRRVRRTRWRRSTSTWCGARSSRCCCSRPRSSTPSRIRATSAPIRRASARTAASTPTARSGHSWPSPSSATGDRAKELFDFFSPIQHTRDADAVRRYKLEPYAVAADIYAAPAPAGRGRLVLVHRRGRLAVPRRAWKRSLGSAWRATNW